MNKKLAFTLLITLSSVFISSASDSCLDRWNEFSHTSDKIKLTEWMKTTATNILCKNIAQPEMDFTLPAPPECTGMFITLIHKGKVRGCFGAFSHSGGTAAEILQRYIKGALFLDPRHNPLEKFELDDTEIVLTVTSNPEPVDDINKVDISNFGLFIECEDSSKTVIVPAEYRTASRITKLTGNSGCRYYRFSGVTIR